MLRPNGRRFATQCRDVRPGSFRKLPVWPSQTRIRPSRSAVASKLPWDQATSLMNVACPRKTAGSNTNPCRRALSPCGHLLPSTAPPLDRRPRRDECRREADTRRTRTGANARSSARPAPPYHCRLAPWSNPTPRIGQVGADHHPRAVLSEGDVVDVDQALPTSELVGSADPIHEHPRSSPVTRICASSCKPNVAAVTEVAPWSSD
jgi:hypothetical protein